MAAEIITSGNEVDGEEVVSDGDVIRMICIAMLDDSDQTLTKDVLEGVLEATNRRHYLDAAQAFADAGGLEDDDEDEDELDDENDEPDDDEEDDEDEDDDADDEEDGDEP